MWFYQTLVTSLLAALFVVVSKKALKSIGAGFLTWITLVIATPLILVFSIKQGIPDLTFLFYIAAFSSALFYSLAKIIMYWSLKDEDLSVVYSISTLGPVLTLIVATLPPLNEIPKYLAIIGVAVTILGSYLLNVSSLKKGLFEPFSKLIKNKGSVLMIISMIISAFVIIFDKIAIKNTNPQNPFFTLLIENLFVIITLGPLLYMRNKNFLQQLSPNKWIIISLGVLSAFYTMIGINAIGKGDVGLVSALRSSQLFFVFMLSYLFFKDKPKLETLLGTIIMVSGIILIKLGS